MVRITDDYVVTVDQYAYTLQVEKHYKDKKTGEDIVKYKPLGYFSSLKKAINYCRQDYIRRQLQEGENQLTDAVNTIRECDRKFEEILTRCLGEEEA